jgi:hypothetical protein
MNAQFAQNIDWNAGGYFGFPDESELIYPMPDSYKQWMRAFQKATRGDFESLPELIELYKQSDDFCIHHLCSSLVGDAGAPECFPILIAEIKVEMEKKSRYELVIDFCDSLFSRGHLSDIPLMLDAYERHAYLDEADIIPCFISQMLEYPVGKLTHPSYIGTLEQYRHAVLERYRQLRDEYKEEHVPILGGARFGVIPLAHMLLDQFKTPHTVASYWRHKFEASTGINCSAFYRDKIFQPDAATALVENFLNSTEADQYQDGVRYFFGRALVG